MQNVIFISVKTLPTGFNHGKQKVFFYPELYSSLLFLPVSVCLCAGQKTEVGSLYGVVACPWPHSGVLCPTGCATGGGG